MSILPFQRRRPTRPSRPARAGVIAALDYGHGKIACAIGQARDDGLVEILGAASLASAGLRHGVVQDLDAAEAVIRQVVGEAEAAAGVGISQLHATFQSRELSTERVRSRIALEPEFEITDRELRRALDAAVERVVTRERAILHALPMGWQLDDRDGPTDPRGMFGRSLGVELLIVSAPAAQVRHLALGIERAQLSLAGLVATPYAAGLSALVPDERQLGATLIDMGAGMTSIARFAEGALQGIATVPVGGQHATNDLAYGLGIPTRDAERLKCLHGAVGDRAAMGGEELVLIHDSATGEAKTITRDKLSLILTARAEETADMISATCARAASLQPVSRVVAVGGQSSLDGIGHVRHASLGGR